MRKFITTIILIITYFIIFYLQTNIFHNFTIAGIMPNLFVIYILYIGLSTNAAYGISFGVFGGIIIDCVYSKTIGITAVMLCLISFLGAYFNKNFSKENKLTIIIMIILSTVIYEVGYYFLNSVIIGFDAEMFYFIKILLIEILYNVLLTIILYPLIQKTGYILDRTFKKNNIMTRYF